MLSLLTRFMRERSPRSLYPDELSYELLSSFHAWLLRPETGRHGNPRTPETARKIVAETEHMWKWAFKRQQRGSWTGVPYPDSLELARDPLPERLAPTWEDMDACIDAAGDYHAKLYFVLRCTGLRVAQAMHLTWDDVDLQAMTLRIRPGLPGSKTKAEKRGRVVPISPVLGAELATWGRREGWLIPSRREGKNERLARDRDAKRAWNRAGVSEEVRELPHHAFRAGFKTGLIRRGARQDAVDYFVGHGRGMNDRYVDPRALHLVAAIGLVPEFGAEGDQVEMFDEAKTRR